MASKYGKGYYNDWYEMLEAVEKGSKRAFKMACRRMADELNERIRGGIYERAENTYERTFEMANIDYITADVQGLECQFRYDNKAFATLTQSNPEHHALTDDRGNDYDTQQFMDEIISPIHDDFMVDLRQYIEDNFQDYYRKCCKEIGFELR